MKMPLEFQLEERCLGHITRNLVKPEITQERGDCKTCEYNFKNEKCKAYTPIVVRIFEVAE